MELTGTLVDVSGTDHNLRDEPSPKYQAHEQSMYMAVGITWSILNLHCTKQVLVNLFTQTD